MALFQTKTSATGVPTDLVLQMRYDGLSNNQIIQNLQRQGFDSNQIFDALSQADIKVQNSPQELTPRPQQRQNQPMQSEPMQSQAFPDMSVLNKTEQVEEVVEALIDEKWGVFEESIKKILNWKSDVEVNIGKLDQRMKAIEDQFKTLQEGIYGKIGEYDKHITHIGTELKAVDKVFQKVLPALADNVAELGNIAGKLKKK